MSGVSTFNADTSRRVSDSRPFERTWRFRQGLDRGLRWLRSCARCGSVLPPIDILCSGCRELLMDQQNVGDRVLQAEYEFPVYALFTWTPANDGVIRPFVYAFKRGYCAGFARDLIIRLVHEIGSRCPLAPGLVYPEAQDTWGGARPDHAWLLARTAAEVVGPTTALVAGLKPGEVGVQSQKTKSVSQRRRRSFRAEKNFSGQGLSWVFVDDVITSGSTAAAARRALGDRERFDAWTLVCRPKLAKPRGFW